MGLFTSIIYTQLTQFIVFYTQIVKKRELGFEMKPNKAEEPRWSLSIVSLVRGFQFQWIRGRFQILDHGSFSVLFFPSHFLGLKFSGKFPHLRRFNFFFDWWYWKSYPPALFAKQIPEYYFIPKLVCFGQVQLWRPRLPIFAVFFTSFTRGILIKVLNEMSLHWVAPNLASDLVLINNLGSRRGKFYGELLSSIEDVCRRINLDCSLGVRS